MISETRFLSGGYSTFVTTSNWWNTWADDDFVSQICRVCEANFCSWHRFSHDLATSGERIFFPLSLPTLFPSSFSISLSFSHKTSNQRKDLRVFWQSALSLEARGVGTGHADSGKREQNIPHLMSHLLSILLLLWVVAWVGGRNCFPAFRPHKEMIVM